MISVGQMQDRRGRQCERFAGSRCADGGLGEDRSSNEGSWGSTSTPGSPAQSWVALANRIRGSVLLTSGETKRR